MIVSLLVAMDERQGIGLAGGLPWHISSDLRRFKALTMGHHIIMGRKTWQSIGRLLPGRRMIVISRNPDFEAEGCSVVNSLKDALQLSRKSGEEEAFIIGGGQIFTQALPLADKIYLTLVRTTTQVDTYFPAFDLSDWKTIHQQEFPAGKDDQFASEFQILVRNRAGKRETEEISNNPITNPTSNRNHLP